MNSDEYTKNLGTIKILRDPNTDRKVSEVHLWDGRPHKEDGPATQRWDETSGHLAAEEWSLHGLLHRDGDLPAVSYYNEETGALEEEHYYHHGSRHRTTGPAYIEYDPVKPPFFVYYVLDLEVSAEEFEARYNLETPDGP